jgi:hypothetical protein
VSKHQFDLNLRRDPERKWGQGHFYQQRERLKYAQGDGSLRHDGDCSIGGFVWPGEVLCGDGCYGERDPSGTYHSAGLEDFVTQLASDQSFETFKNEFFKTVRPSSLIKRFETTDEVARMVTLCAVLLPPALPAQPSVWMAEPLPHVSNH